MLTAKYTELLYNLLQNPECKALIDEALSEYPLHLPKNPANYMVIPTREEINKKLLDHYKYREIGFETIGRFIDELRIAMDEIMPYYNQLFNSEDIINGLEDIFGNLDVIEEFEEETTGDSSISGSETKSDSSEASSEGSDTSSVEGDSENLSKHITSETPQGNIATTSASNIDSVSHADKVDWDKASNNSTSETHSSTNSSSSASSNSSVESSTAGTSSGSRKHTLHRKGNQGVNTYAHDMLEFRGLFDNIVMRIINDSRIKELFMIVY